MVACSARDWIPVTVTVFPEMVYVAPNAFTASNVATMSFERMIFSILLVPFAKAADKIARRCV